MRIPGLSAQLTTVSLFLALGLAGLAGLSAACGDDFAQVTEGEIADVADIAFQQTPIGRSTQQQFRIRNNGDGDLIIRNIEIVDASPYIHFSDGFMIAMASQYDWENAATEQSWTAHPPFVLGPDRELQVDLEFAPTTQDPQCPSGDPITTCGRIVIESDDRDERTLEANITLNQSAGSISVDPTFLSFPALVGGPWTEEFTIQNVGSGPLTGIQLIDPGVEGLTLAEADARPEPFTLDPFETSTYEVTFSPVGGVEYCTGGATSCTLGIITVDSDDAQGQVISITVAVGQGTQADIAVSRNRIEFATAAVGNPETQTVDVSNEGGANLTWNIRIDPAAVRNLFALEVAGTALPSSGANISQPIAPGNAQTVSITFEPESEEAVAGQLVITSNDPDESPLRIDLFGGAAAPDLDVMPSSLLFNEVDRGASADLQLVLVNTGRATLSIDSYTILGASAAEFGVSPDLAGESIGPGSRLPVTVTYARPEDDVSGLDNATLQILSDALEPNDTYNVPLFAYHGEAALPPTADIAVSPDQAQFDVGETITLDASGSEPPEGGSFGGNPYSWALLDRPTASEAELSSSFEEQTTLTPDAAGTYAVLLTVTAIIDATTNTQAQRTVNLLVVE